MLKKLFGMLLPLISVGLPFAQNPETRKGGPGSKLPKGWTSEKRRVKVATPNGEERKEIAYYKNTLGMEFVKIPAGRFKMGSGLSPEETARRFGGNAEFFNDEHPQHGVRISQAFFLGAHEVTNAQYRRFQAAHNSGDYRGKSLNADAQPVMYVSWENAKAFCEWLSKREGVTYRLPTEAEWEYACRAGSRSPYPWGEKISSRYCNYADKNTSFPWSDKTADYGHAVAAPVGSFPANGFGAHDTIGNVWEWCADWYDEDYYKTSPASDPTGPRAGGSRVLRGGSWNSDPWLCQSAIRFRYPPDTGGYGFRVVCASR